MSGAIRGPVPKRTEERRRPNEPDIPIVKAPGAEVVVIPPADENWHPLAIEWYDSLKDSGQSRFYEPSDWATAKVIAEAISRELKPQLLGFRKIRDLETGIEETEPVFGIAPVKGASLAGWLKGMSSLMVTEGDRRRMRFELERPQLPDFDGELPDGVTAISAGRDSILG